LQSPLQKVLQRALSQSEPLKAREDAFLQLGLLLEKNSSASSGKNFYAQFLDPSFLDLQLAEAEKRSVIDQMGKMINSDTETNLEIISAGIASLGSSRDAGALEHLLAFFEKNAASLNYELLHHLISSLDDFVFVGDEPAIKSVLNRFKYASRLRQLYPTNNERVDERIQETLRILKQHKADN
jgi:hypothetical protein